MSDVERPLSSAAATPSERDLAIVAEVAAALNAQPDLERSLAAALAKVAELLGLRTGWVWLLEPGGGASYVAAARHLPPALAEHPERLDGGCYCLDTFRKGDLAGAANVNVVRCSRLRWLDSGTDGLTHHASIPLYAGSGAARDAGDEDPTGTASEIEPGRKLGLLNVAAEDWRELDADELRVLHTIGDLLGIAIERARLYDRSLALGAAEERNRIAREIHDTLAQGLVGITLQLEAADMLLGAEDPGHAERARETVADALRAARETLEEARRSVGALRAAPLEERTLPEALATLAAEVEAGYGLSVRTDLAAPSRPLPPRQEHAAYRIARESLRNAARHAGATTLRLELQISSTHLDLRITDDGRGFDPAATAPDRFGLRGMRERAAALGGAVLIDGRPGKGTTVSLRLPLLGADPDARP